MTENSARKKAIRAVMAQYNIPYAEAARRLDAQPPCDHYLIVGSDYDGDDVITCMNCHRDVNEISNADAEYIELACEVHTLAEARAAGVSPHVCMQAYGIGDEGDGHGPVLMSCEPEYPGWAD